MCILVPQNGTVAHSLRTFALKYLLVPLFPPHPIAITHAQVLHNICPFQSILRPTKSSQMLLPSYHASVETSIAVEKMNLCISE